MCAQSLEGVVPGIVTQCSLGHSFTVFHFLFADLETGLDTVFARAMATSSLVSSVTIDVDAPPLVWTAKERIDLGEPHVDEVRRVHISLHEGSSEGDENRLTDRTSTTSTNSQKNLPPPSPVRKPVSSGLNVRRNGPGGGGVAGIPPCGEKSALRWPHGFIQYVRRKLGLALCGEIVTKVTKNSWAARKRTTFVCCDQNS